MLAAFGGAQARTGYGSEHAPVRLLRRLALSVALLGAAWPAAAPGADLSADEVRARIEEASGAAARSR